MRGEEQRKAEKKEEEELVEEQQQQQRSKRLEKKLKKKVPFFTHPPTQLCAPSNSLPRESTALRWRIVA